MVLQDKIRKYIFFILLSVSFCFVLYNGLTQMKKVRDIRRSSVSKYEKGSAEKIQNKFKQIKYIIFQMERSREAYDILNVKDNKYYSMLETQRELREKYFLLSALEVQLDIVLYDDNKGISQRESYDLDVFLERYGLKISDVANQKKIVARNGKVLYFYPSYHRGNGYMFTLDKYMVREFKDDDMGQWFLRVGDENYSFKTREMVPENPKDQMVYDGDLKLGFVFRERNVMTGAVFKIIFGYIILPMFLVLLGSYYLSEKIAERFYHPLKGILSGLEPSKDGEENLEYVVNYLEQIKNQNVQMKDEMSYMLEAVKEKDVKDFIYGAVPASYLMEKYSYFKDFKYRAIILKFDSDEFKEGLFVVKGELQNTLTDSLVLNIDNSHYMILLKEGTKEDKKVLKKLMVDLYKKYEVEGVGFYSEKIYRIEDLYRSFSSFYKYLDYKFVLEENIIIDEKDVEEDKGKKYYYPIELEQRWMNKYVKGNLQGTKLIIDEIFTENFQERKIDTKAFETLKILLFNSLKRLGSEETEGYQEEFMKVDTPHDLKQKLLEILKECEGDLVPKEKGSNVSLTADKIDEFIEKNYTRDISLLDLSEYLGISLQYASNLHKKVKGENFNQYLNRYRIERAVEILKKDDSVKIKDLASMVGYINTNTFINNFKKIKGTSPGKFGKN